MRAANPWITYRTRFLVKAKQLTTSLTFTDVLGRPHSGCKGDYLVESAEGVLTIAPRQIFEDIYVPLQTEGSDDFTIRPQKSLRARKSNPSGKTLPQPETPMSVPLASSFVPKTVQSYRDHPASSPRLHSI